MPIYEYDCPVGHHSTKLYTTFKEAEPFIDSAQCSECGVEAKRVQSVPFEAHFYGNPDGYYKPSPSKRFSTKLVNSNGNN